MNHVGDCEGMAVVAGVHREHLGDREVRLDAALLQHDADALTQFGAAVRGVHAEHRDVARIARAVALEDLDRRGLASTVGAEHSNTLALVDREADAVHRMHLAVGFLQVGDFDHRHDRGPISITKVTLLKSPRSTTARVGQMIHWQDGACLAPAAVR